MGKGDVYWDKRALGETAQVLTDMSNIFNYE